MFDGHRATPATAYEEKYGFNPFIQDDTIQKILGTKDMTIEACEIASEDYYRVQVRKMKTEKED